MMSSPSTQVSWLSVPADRVRWEDVDLAGVMRYSAYTRVVDLAEAELLRAAGLSVTELAERLGVWLPRKVLHVEYAAPALLDEALRVEVRVAKVGTTAITFRMVMYAAERETRLAEAELVLVCVGRDDFVKRPLPTELVDRLAPWTDVAEG